MRAGIRPKTPAVTEAALSPPGDPQPSPSAGADAPSGPARGALAFIFITVLLDALALGMVLPVLPKLVATLLAGEHLSPRLARHLPRNTVALAAAMYGLFNTVFALMQFFCSPVIGSLSDRFGRRPLILASNVGLGLSYLLMWWAPNLQWLFLGRLVSGVTGASLGTASAYIADSTSQEKRAGAFGLLGAAFGLGLILGPAIGGPLGEFVSPRAPFAVAAAFSLLNAAYGLFVLPESLGREHRSAFSWKRANPVGALVLLQRHPELMGLAAVAFLSNLAQVSLPTTVVLYVIHRFGWGTGQVGLTLGVVGVALALVQVLVLGRYVKRFGLPSAVVTGLLFGAAGLTATGLAATGTAVWLAVPLLALWGLSGPAVQGLMTRHVSVSEQGQLQGANASLTGISELVGPTVFSLVFAYSVKSGQPHWAAGAPFLLGAGILGVAAVAGWWATRLEAPNDPEEQAAGC